MGSASLLQDEGVGQAFNGYTGRERVTYTTKEGFARSLGAVKGQ
jgi:hypothetical protein